MKKIFKIILVILVLLISFTLTFFLGMWRGANAYIESREYVDYNQNKKIGLYIEEKENTLIISHCKLSGELITRETYKLDTNSYATKLVKEIYFPTNIDAKNYKLKELKGKKNVSVKGHILITEETLVGDKKVSKEDLVENCKKQSNALPADIQILSHIK